MEEGDFLTFGEAELLIEGLKPTKMETMGSKEWRKQHDYLCRLNQQVGIKIGLHNAKVVVFQIIHSFKKSTPKKAQLNAQSGTSEFVGELASTKRTMKTLIYELLTSELWRHKIVPFIIKTKFAPKSTLPFYTALYNEAVICKCSFSEILK